MDKLSLSCNQNFKLYKIRAPSTVCCVVGLEPFTEVNPQLQ